mgnify:CR=1 FL=1
MKKYSPYLLLLALFYFPIFGFLDVLPIRIWDESRLALNALEMSFNSDFIVTYFEGKPDMWNTKPPLLIWFQVLFIKMIGYSEVALRLPSALAAFSTCSLVFYMTTRYLKSSVFGFITAFIIVTSVGFIGVHSSRTGDYDALLAFFTTASSLSFFIFLESKKTKYIYFFFSLLALGVLTKSITGLFFLPGLFLYTLITKNVLPMLRNKHFYFGVFIFLGIVFCYYFIRESQNSGYLLTVWNNELGGRFANALENNEESFWFYYDNLLNTRYAYWFILVPIGIVVGFLNKNERIKRITVFSTLLTITFVLIISSAKTKLIWYDVPMYPFLAVLAGNSVYLGFLILKDLKITDKFITLNVLPVLFIFVICTQPYREIMHLNYKPVEAKVNSTYSISYHLKSLLDNNLPLDFQYVVYEGYHAHIDYYLVLLDKEGKTSSLKSISEVEVGDVIILAQKELMDQLELQFKYEIVRRSNQCKIYKIYERIE